MQLLNMEYLKCYLRKNLNGFLIKIQIVITYPYNTQF